MTKDYSLTTIVIEQAHTILGHFSAQKTVDYICRWYWWPQLGVKVSKYCTTCGICQVNKTNRDPLVSCTCTHYQSLTNCGDQ